MLIKSANKLILWGILILLGFLATAAFTFWSSTDENLRCWRSDGYTQNGKCQCETFNKNTGYCLNPSSSYLKIDNDTNRVFHIDIDSSIKLVLDQNFKSPTDIGQSVKVKFNRTNNYYSIFAKQIGLVASIPFYPDEIADKWNDGDCVFSKLPEKNRIKTRGKVERAYLALCDAHDFSTEYWVNHHFRIEEVKILNPPANNFYSGNVTLSKSQ